MTRDEMAWAVSQIRDAVAEVSPIRWCKPAGVADVTAATIAAAQDNHVNRLEVVPKYPDVPRANILNRLRECQHHLRSIDDHPMAQPIGTYLDRAAETVTAVASRDDNQFSAWSARSHGIPSDEIVAKAWQILDEEVPHDDEPHDISAEDLRNSMLTVLGRYNLQNWDVITMERMSTVAVDQATRQIMVRTDAQFSHSEVARLLVHEVGAHVLRGVNASRQADPTAMLPLGNAVATEEGLAGWLEQQFDVATPRIPRIYAARTIAAHLASTEGILPIVRTLAPYVGWADAAAVGLRVKRGLSDFNKAGGYLKDQAYLQGLNDLTTALQSSPHHLKPLMTVKWSIEYLDHAYSMLRAGALQAPDLAPDRRNLGLMMADSNQVQPDDSDALSESHASGPE